MREKHSRYKRHPQARQRSRSGSCSVRSAHDARSILLATYRAYRGWYIGLFICAAGDSERLYARKPESLRKVDLATAKMIQNLTVFHVLGDGLRAQPMAH